MHRCPVFPTRTLKKSAEADENIKMSTLCYLGLFNHEPSFLPNQAAQQTCTHLPGSPQFTNEEVCMKKYIQVCQRLMYGTTATSPLSSTSLR
mmetsp:Transcript_38495/g.46485  ORF Transcript_38495/g.46485 Transcript_38495/m.46485 type:complete len:92 (-) Transcript_38495:1322-1597(-)